MSTPTTTGTTSRKTTVPRATTAKTAGDTTATRSTAKTLSDHLSLLQEGEVLTPQGMHEFLEAMRALTTGVAFFAEAASTQLEAAMRKGAQDSKDGRLTMAEKAKLKLVLRRVNRDIETLVKDALLDAARGSVKAYSHMQAFLDEMESTQVSRPHRRTTGGFNPFGD